MEHVDTLTIQVDDLLFVLKISLGQTSQGVSVFKMGRVPKITGPGNKRKRYTITQKHEVYKWKMFNNMSLKNIQKKFKQIYNIDAAQGTLAGFYNAEMQRRFRETAMDRINVTDVRINSKQRPDVLVDLENILARRCNAVGRTGIPYIWKIAQMLAIHIFNKLVATQIYNAQGQRKEQISLYLMSC